MCALGNKPVAFYVTSPDYLGNIADIKGFSEVCHKHDVLLLCDNAHGAYLNFLPFSKHPIALGADMCCDSAHKTLPVLTGGAYLHISKDAPDFYRANLKNALMLFGSSSPSYLTLCSLDNANKYINEGYKENLFDFCKEVNSLKATLQENGYSLIGDEKLKLTIETKKYGYLGSEFYEILYNQGIICEFYDPDYVVMMLTPENSKKALDVVKNALLSIPQKSAISDTPPSFSPCETVFSPKDAHFMAQEKINIKNACDRILGSLNVSCPPCVSVICCGERFNESAVELCKYYSIKECFVVKE
jgi:arginine/lysine/ornithine decarboxylase